LLKKINSKFIEMDLQKEIDLRDTINYCIENKKQNMEAMQYDTVLYAVPDRIYKEAITANNFSFKRYYWIRH